ncbi:class F sortase [Actinomadura barringtoniae]|uniref:Class F sortase n=1 Tax=Actinomadura barringtoniae TaxID=1427535 RepID=A0A939TBD2_9ACTN|nr:class F sortase [Actinomadura barringtoniae]MBO2450040.1 class F sortase [Actinomadura barringtoniae]
MRARFLAGALVVTGGLLLISGLNGPGGPPQPPASAAAEDHPVPASGMAGSQPTTIAISAIGVRAPIMNVGMAADGTVDVPPLDHAGTAGWYDRGPSPGQRGPAVILGHVDSAASGAAVFYRLGDLRPGALVEVRRRDGSTAEFDIDSVERFNKDSFPTQRVYGQLNYPGLRLITCGGTFDRATGHYTDNVIAFGHLVRRPDLIATTRSLRDFWYLARPGLRWVSKGRFSGGVGGRPPSSGTER